MEYIFNTRLRGNIALTDSYHTNLALQKDNTLYKFIWVQSGSLQLEIDHVPTTLVKGEIIPLTPLHHIEFKAINGEYLTLLFNSNFYCIFGHDNEVSCNGFLFNGTSNVMQLKLSESQVASLRDITDSLTSEYAIKDNLQEEMLRILLKRFIILCTRIAREKFSVSPEREKAFDMVRQFYVLVDNHFKEKKMGLRGLPKEELPKSRDILPKIYLIIPLVVLVYMIINGKTMATAAVYATFYTITVCMINREPSKGKKAVMALSMLPLLVLTFAWGLKSFAARLDAAAFVQGLFAGRETLTALFPLVLFLVGGLLAFATGTSWGTMGILIPVAVPVFAGSSLLPAAVAAVCAGAVMGDHCSPISDTTIMASAGAHCSHVNHVSTQLPYAITAASCSAACYVITGLTQMFLGSSASLWTSLILLGVAIVLELVVLNILRVKLGKKTKA